LEQIHHHHCIACRRDRNGHHVPPRCVQGEVRKDPYTLNTCLPPTRTPRTVDCASVRKIAILTTVLINKESEASPTEYNLRACHQVGQSEDICSIPLKETREYIEERDSTKKTESGASSILSSVIHEPASHKQRKK